MDALCGRFTGLSPFEVMNTDLEDVYALYVDVIIHDYKENKEKPHSQSEWVTSATATWH